VFHAYGSWSDSTAVPSRGVHYEEKIDGWRMLAYKNGREVRLVSHNGVDRFPELAVALAALPGSTLVLDGEVAIFDRQLRSRFEWLREPDPSQIATPALLMAIDLLHRTGPDQTRLLL